MFPLFHIQNISIFSLYNILLFSIINNSNQLMYLVSLSNQTCETLPMINACRDIFGCNRTESNNFSDVSYGICENCRYRSLELECPSILVNNSYQLLSFTDGFNVELNKIINGKENNSAVRENMVNGSNVLLSGKFVEISGAENCVIDENNQVEFLQETYLIYNQNMSDKNIRLSVTLKNPSKVGGSAALEVPDWALEKNKNSHILYAYTRFKGKIETGSEIQPAIKSLIFNNILSLISISCNSNNKQIYNVKVCMRVSCIKSKKNDFNSVKKEKNKSKTIINDVIASVNKFKGKVSSESDYLLYISIFIKTLLKSLERKTIRGKISVGCSTKMISWVVELCEILGISTDDNSKMGRYISKFRADTKKERSHIKKITNNTKVLEPEPKDKLIEAELGDYEILERELREL